MPTRPDPTRPDPTRRSLLDELFARDGQTLTVRAPTQRSTALSTEPRLPFGTACDAAAAIVAKEVSSRELTEAALRRIEAINPRLNAIVELRAEAALREATLADRAGAGGSLHGVPITVKEAFNVAGLHTTWGNPAFANCAVDRDATVVSRLRDAGAILLGKTNAHFMLADFAQTFNDLYGRTNNPWDVEMTPGGSSGGSAAAVAAGLSYLDYGSDLVGSIRIPAAFCGVYGLKPTVGVVPVAGLQPPGPPSPESEMLYMSHVGPFARSAGDLRTGLKATGGPEHPGYSWDLAAPRATKLRDYRVGVVIGDVSNEVGAVLSDAVDTLATAGVTIIEGWPEGIDPASELEAFGYHVELFLALSQPSGSFERLPELIGYEQRRMAARSAWAQYYRDVDVFLCPVKFTPAFPHDPRPFHERTVPTSDGDRPYDAQTFWIAHASLPGLPAVSAPIGRTSRGLPVGAQIIGPLHEDDTAITFAELMAEIVGGYEPPPMGRA
jgi:amidase